MRNNFNQKEKKEHLKTLLQEIGYQEERIKKMTITQMVVEFRNYMLGKR